MEKIIIADISPLEARIALLENNKLAEVSFERRERERLVGNIYKGRVANVLPGMQAAFVDIGQNRNAFLYAGDILVDKSDFEFENEENKKPTTAENNINISEMLKVGQDIMVQVLKQPGGNKGARVTTHITLPGRCIVLMPTVDHIGVSRKIEDESERERLKHEVEQIKTDQMGIIVRTIGEGQSGEDFIRELNFLKRLWERVQKRFLSLSSPKLLHAEETLVFRTVRDVFTEDVSKFIINNREYYEKVLAVVSITAPHMAQRVEYFDKHYDIFAYHDISAKVSKILNRRVWLKCGGYLIIDETEALTVIDVNTGKYVGDNDLQETILDVNLEAADEIAAQLRLRDISGIIVIDFIDMEKEENKDAVLEHLKAALKSDRTKTNVVGITGLGLVEMTRKKVRRQVSALTKKECPYCQGLAMIDSEETVAHNLRREIIRMINETSFNEYIIEIHPEIADFIWNREDIGGEIRSYIEDKKFFISPLPTLHRSEFSVRGIIDSKHREEIMSNGLREL